MILLDKTSAASAAAEAAEETTVSRIANHSTVPSGVVGGGISGQAVANILWGLAKPGRLSLTGSAADGVIGMVRRRLDLALAGCISTRTGKGSRPSSSSAASYSPLVFNPSELASVLYSFAKLEHRPPADVLQRFLDCSLKHMPRTPTAAPTPPHTHGLLHGAAGGEGMAAPISSPRSGSSGAGIPRGKSTPRFTPQDLANMAWALSSLGVRPGPEWLQAFWAVCCAQLPAFNTKDLAQTAYSLARLGWDVNGLEGSVDGGMAQGALVKDDLEMSAPAPLPEASRPTSSSASTLTAPADTKVTTGVGALTGIADNVGAVSLPPGVGLLLTEAASALPRCSSQDLANLTWGIAQMGLRPPQGWCQVCELALI